MRSRRLVEPAWIELANRDSNFPGFSGPKERLDFPKNGETGVWGKNLLAARFRRHVDEVAVP